MRFTTALLILIAGCVPRPPAAPATAALAEAAAAMPAADASGCTERPDWARAFTAEGGQGTFVLYTPATGRTDCLDAARAATRFLPASTFKLYNALVAVETGVVGDVDSVFVWDGVRRSVPQWNRSNTLRTGMKYSVVWVYQRVATRVGRARYLAAFAREPYGNGVLGDSLQAFWLDGSLQITALEQVRFVDRLRTGRTGFSRATEATVRGIAPVLDERRGAHGPVRILGKTGVGNRPGLPALGWIVGWVERDSADGGPVVFAINAEALPGAAGARFDVAPARLRIVEAILERAGVLPRASE